MCSKFNCTIHYFSLNSYKTGSHGRPSSVLYSKHATDRFKGVYHKDQMMMVRIPKAKCEVCFNKIST